MKKVISMAMALMVALGALSTAAFASEANDLTARVNVTIADKGQLVVTQSSVSVSDIDGDGVLTVNDALYAVHEAKYEGGAAAGYSAYTGDYGLSIGKLWGDESGSYGYQVNNASAWSLANPVEEGDYIYAYVYSDQTAWSDAYSYFDVCTVSSTVNGEITLTLSASGYDAQWNPITVAVEGATVTVNGTATSYKTDAEGKVTLKLEDAGEYVISATSETLTLVPPICIATVEADATDAPETELPVTGDNLLVDTVIALSAIGGVIAVFAVRRKSYEK